MSNFEMSKKKLSEWVNYPMYDFTPKKQRHETEIKRYLISEWKMALFGLTFSMLVLTAKIYYINHEYIQTLLINRELVTLENIVENGEVMYTYAWKKSVKFSKYWLPLLCGLLTTYFTWLMVYLDSNVPGVQPPSPLSPTKFKKQSGHIFHLNYVFALMIGILVFFYTFWKGVSL